jgi:hypothetical protein
VQGDESAAELFFSLKAVISSMWSALATVNRVGKKLWLTEVSELPSWEGPSAENITSATELSLGAVLALQHEMEMPNLDNKTINYSTLHQFLSMLPIPAQFTHA